MPVFGEDARELRAHPVGRHRGTGVGTADDDRDGGDGMRGMREGVARLEGRRAGGVEGGVVRDEVGGDLDHVGGGGRTVEGGGEHAVERGDAVAARIEDHAALRPQPAREGLRGVEGT